MDKLLASSKIYISTSKIAHNERGVFASRSISKGELIERCPIIEVSKDDTSNLTETILVTYFFYFGGKKEKIIISLGFGSIYNHSYEPNAVYKINIKKKVMDIVALRNIDLDEEILINYIRGNPKGKAPLWFDVTR